MTYAWPGIYTQTHSSKWTDIDIYTDFWVCTNTTRTCSGYLSTVLVTAWTHTHTGCLITVTKCVITLIVQTCSTLTAWWALEPQSHKRTIIQALISKLSSSAMTPSILCVWLGGCGWLCGVCKCFVLLCHGVWNDSQLHLLGLTAWWGPKCWISQP